MEKDFATDVFYTAYGMLLPAYKIEGVENLFEPGKPFHTLYNEAIDAYNRVCVRLGIPVDNIHESPPEEDEDLLELLNNMESICQHVAMEMFRCGIAFRDGKIAPNPANAFLDRFDPTDLIL